MQIVKVLNNEKKLTSKPPIAKPTASSNSLKSFVSRFKILPVGTLLKKLPKLAYNNDLIILL